MYDTWLLNLFRNNFTTLQMRFITARKAIIMYSNNRNYNYEEGKGKFYYRYES